MAGTYTAIVWLVTFFFHKEVRILQCFTLEKVDDGISQQTHSSPKSIREFLRGEKKRVVSERDTLLTTGTPPQNGLDEPVPLRDLLTRDVIVASASYSFPALLDVSFRTLQPIFFATPVALGGLGLDPPVIGKILTFFGVLSGVFAVFYSPRMADCVGVKWVYLVGATAAIPCFSLFPFINQLARNSDVEGSDGLGVEVWVAVGLQVVMAVLICTCYGMSYFKIEPPIDLCPSLARFRRSIHLCCYRCTKQSFIGSHKWIFATVGDHRACGGTCPSELDVLAVDRRGSSLYGRLVGILCNRGAEPWGGLGGVVVAEASFEGYELGSRYGPPKSPLRSWGAIFCPAFASLFTFWLLPRAMLLFMSYLLHISPLRSTRLYQRFFPLLPSCVTCTWVLWGLPLRKPVDTWLRPGVVCILQNYRSLGVQAGSRLAPQRGRRERLPQSLLTVDR